MIKILFICHGNICRSTMAESVFTDMVYNASNYKVKDIRKELGIEFEIDSAATSREEIGNGPHYGTVSKLESLNIPVVPHRARQMTRDDYLHYDYIIGMDQVNIRNIARIAGGDPEEKIFKMLQFADYEKTYELNQNAKDVADPWYTGNFDVTYSDISKGLRGLLAYIEKNN